MKNKKPHYAWIILLGVILIRGFAGGGINSVSGLFLYPVSRDIGVGIGTLSIYLSITSIVMVLWLPLAGRLINRYDVRLVAAAGAVLQALSFMSFGLMNSVYGWYLMAVPYAMGSTILVSLLGPILINRWFAGNTGMMLGLQMAFVGLFGSVFQPAASKIISVHGWRAGYLFVGGVTLTAVLLSSVLFLRNRPEDKSTSPYRTGTQADRSAGRKESDLVEIPEKMALHSASFYLLLFFMISITGIGVFTQHIPTYGALLGYTTAETGNALAYASIGSAAGSIAIGVISDRIGSLKTCYGVLGSGFLAMAGYLLSGSSLLLFRMSAFCQGLISAGIMVLSPILTLRFYGRKDYEKIFAKVSMGAPIASVILIPVYGFIYDMTNSYRFVLLLMIGLLSAALFCISAGWKYRCTQAGCPVIWKNRR